MIILIPFPLFFSQFVFGTKSLATWVAVGIAWTFLAAFAVVIYPLYESREALLLVSKGIIKVCQTWGKCIAKILISFPLNRTYSIREAENILKNQWEMLVHDYYDRNLRMCIVFSGNWVYVSSCLRTAGALMR